MALPYYVPFDTSRPAPPITQYYPNTMVPMNHVLQFQQNQSMMWPPYPQQIYSSPAPAPAQGYVSDPKHFMPRYSMVAPNVYASQPPINYHGLTTPFVHMPNVIYSNPAMPSPNQNYSPIESDPAQSYVSQLKSTADLTTDTLEIPDSMTLSEAKAVPQKNLLTDVSVIIDNTPALESESRRGYEQPSSADPSLGQQYVFRDAYQPGPGQSYISKIRAINEGIPYDDPRLYTTYPKRSRPGYNSASPLLDSQGEPPVEGKRRRNTCKNPSRESKSEKSRSRFKSPPTYLPPDNEALASYENKTHEYDRAYFSKDSRSNWYPKPVSTNFEHMYIGSNGTIVPPSVYTRIAWKSVEKSTRILMESIFNDGSLATHSLERLDPTKVQDIVTLVAEKCFVNEEAVRTVISKICADASSMSQDVS